MGELKKKPSASLTPLDAMANNMKDGLCFRFSKVALIYSKQEYTSSPKKIVINLAAAKLEPILAKGGKPPEPQPAMTVAQVLGF